MTKRPGINERISSLSSVKEAPDTRAKAGAMAEAYRTTANRLGATGDDAASRTAARRAEVLGKMAKSSPPSTAKPKSGARRAPTQAMMTKQRAREDYKATFGKDAAKSLTTSQMDNAVARQRHLAAEHARLGNAVQSINGPPKSGKAVDIATKPPASRGLDIGGRVRDAAAAKSGAVDPVKLIEKRNATARSLAEQAKFTGVDAGRGAAARDLVTRNTSDLSRLGNDAHMGTTSHAAPPPASPPTTPKEPMLSRIGNAYGKAQTGLTIAAAGAQGAHAFSEDRAAGGSVGHASYEGMKAAAPSAAIAGAQPLARGLHAFGDGALALSGELAKQTGLADMVFLDLAFAKGAVVTGAAGMAAKGAGAVLSAAGKVALPAAAAVGAYQGAREDQNTVRGIGRGVVRSLDPTGIVTGLTGHGPGLAERVYDAAFGKAQERFKQAAAPAKDSQVADGKRGWANPKVQAAAQAARGRTYSGQE